MVNNITCELYKGFKQLKMIIFLIVMAGAPLLGALGSMLLKQTPDIANDPQLMASLTFSSLEFPLYVLGGVVDLLVPVFIVILIADSITEDYIKGTMKLPLIAPIRREKVLLSKFIAIGIEIATLLGVLLVASYITGFVFFETSSTFTYQTALLTVGEGIGLTLLAYGLTLVVLMVFTLVISLIALQFKSTGSVIAVSVGMIIVAPLVSLFGENATKAIITNYFKFYNMLFVEGTSYDLFQGVGIVSLYGLTAFILSLGIFKKKDILY